MRYFIQFIFISCFLSLTVLGCDDSSSNDRENPRIELVSVSDTFYIDSLRVNNYSVRFEDNEALSTYFLELHPSSNFPNADSLVSGSFGDSIAFQHLKIKDRVNIFGQDTASASGVFELPNSFSIYDKTSLQSKTYKVRTGLYSLKIVCLDKAGNRDSIFADKNITVLYPQKYYRDTVSVTPSTNM